LEKLALIRGVTLPRFGISNHRLDVLTFSALLENANDEVAEA
jgi:hypothetical protein